MRPVSLNPVRVPPVSNNRVSTNSTSNEDQVADDEVDVVIEEEVTLRIVRPPGTGLGISIAGGAGSTPYKDDDEV